MQERNVLLNISKFHIKGLYFFPSESMKIWKLDILTLSSKSSYISLARIDQEDLLPDNITYFTLLVLESINLTNIPGEKTTDFFFTSF